MFIPRGKFYDLFRGYKDGFFIFPGGMERNQRYEMAYNQREVGMGKVNLPAVIHTAQKRKSFI